jgi:hypothetical protein
VNNTYPLLPEIEVPVLKKTVPVTPADSASELFTTSEPEPDDTLAPLVSCAEPPRAAVVVEPPLTDTPIPPTR